MDIYKNIQSATESKKTYFKRRKFGFKPLILKMEIKMNKGIFWVCKDENGFLNLLTVKVLCDKDGTALRPIIYSAKSGNNFNHKLEWEKFDRKTTGNHPYNYYPRGRVEIKDGKITIYLNPILNRKDIIEMILTEFHLTEPDVINRVNIKSDGSFHYQYKMEEEL